MLKKIWAWIKSKKLTGFNLLSFGLSWDDKQPQKQENQDQKQSAPFESNGNKTYPCRYCNQSGRDNYYPDTCRVCNGSGSVKGFFNSPSLSSYCKGTGRDPYRPTECKVCGGVGLVEGN